MQRWTIPARVAAAAAVAVMTSAAVTPAAALATDPTTGVTVFLKAPNTAALRALANAHGLTHAQRVSALRAVLPTESERARAIAALHAEGLKVTNQSAWSVSATAPTSTVAHAFGTHAVARAHATSAERAAATGPYPQLPASLQKVATAVFPTTGGPAAFHPQDLSCINCLDGQDFRNAYNAPQTVPTSGNDTAATLTVATIQLAGWNPGDLTNWANTPGNVVGPQFNATTGITLVPVDQASVPAPAAKDDSDEEVDLDQESLLGTDPYAHQRPYFAPNTDAGVADAFSQVLDDVLQDSDAYQGGDSHIVAVSDSWGSCEADTGRSAIETLEPILMSLEAAGVTIFSSSGDQGIYDNCSETGVDTDYPTSSPEVVSVGGTSLSPVGVSAPNDNTNWTESGWSCTSFADCTKGNGGSGGGVSLYFAKPAYQSKITNAPFAAVVNRMVPDISADAAPDTGFRIYTSDPEVIGNGENQYLQIGGTSLAAPETAALFTNVLAAHGLTSGIGDIHQGLYNAYAANVGAFRDITTGTNGASKDGGSDPSVSAGTGYDTVTGLGAPLWPLVAPYLFAAEQPISPKATSSLVLTHPRGASLPRQVMASWAGVESSSKIAIQNTSVTIVQQGKSQPVYANPTAPASGNYTFNGIAGATYQVTVTATDALGDKSRQVTSTLPVPIDDRAFRFNGNWHRATSPNDYAGSAEITNAKSSYATATATGRTYALLVNTGPNSGKLRIAWNGFTLKTISLYSAQPGSRLVPFFDSGTEQSRTFTFTALGKAGSPSYGSTVALDGMTVVY